MSLVLGDAVEAARFGDQLRLPQRPYLGLGLRRLGQNAPPALYSEPALPVPAAILEHPLLILCIHA
jgi:hypothetical protein